MLIQGGSAAAFWALDNSGTLSVVDTPLAVDQSLSLRGGVLLVKGSLARTTADIASVLPARGALVLDQADVTVHTGLLVADPASQADLSSLAAGAQLVLRNDAVLTLSELHTASGAGGPTPALTSNGGNLELHDSARIVGADGLAALPRLQANLAGARLALRDGAVLTLNGDFSNAGTVDIGGGTALHAQNLTQSDGLLTVDGVLDNGSGVTTLLGGVLNGSGTINGDLFVGGGPGTASFRPGHSPGHMTITGAFTLSAGGVLELEIQRGTDGLLHWDVVSADSMSFEAGSLIKILVDSNVGDQGQATLSLLDCPNGCSFAGDVQVIGDSGGTAALDPAGGLYFSLAAVPEPGTWVLFAAGLLVIVASSRGRRPLRDSPGLAAGARPVADCQLQPMA
jgi:hypothetical protein